MRAALPPGSNVTVDPCPHERHSRNVEQRRHHPAQRQVPREPAEGVEALEGLSGRHPDVHGCIQIFQGDIWCYSQALLFISKIYGLHMAQPIQTADGSRAAEAEAALTVVEEGDGGVRCSGHER